MKTDISFDKQVQNHQIEWRHRQGKTISKEHGWQNGVQRQWILPSDEWEKSLWGGIARDSNNSLPDYLTKTKIKRHTGSHNLKSSWVMCANLYFAFRNQGDLLVGFLREKIDNRISKVERFELEYEDDDQDLKPLELLGEPDDGGRGSGQTSPDMGIVVKLRTGEIGLIMVENKYTEHSFYRCSGRKGDSGMPEKFEAKCFDLKLILSNPSKHCWQCNWAPMKKKNRKYWPHLLPIIDKEAAAKLTRCPSATSGYQLFRQHALAEGIANKSGAYALVASCVAYDERNKTLQNCLRTTGVDWRSEWDALFSKGKANFGSWTHQAWVDFVRRHKNASWQDDWLKYVSERYKL